VSGEPTSPKLDPEGVGGTPTRFRRAEPPDFLGLSAEGRVFVASLDESVRPYWLAVRFPRIVNKMAQLWRQPRQMDRYLDELLVDTRGTRQGFPLRILAELVRLEEHYRTAVWTRSWNGNVGGERER
jgi:hypothetical protein